VPVQALLLGRTFINAAPMFTEYTSLAFCRSSDSFAYIGDVFGGRPLASCCERHYTSYCIVNSFRPILCCLKSTRRKSCSASRPLCVPPKRRTPHSLTTNTLIRLRPYFYGERKLLFDQGRLIFCREAHGYDKIRPYRHKPWWHCNGLETTLISLFYFNYFIIV